MHILVTGAAGFIGRHIAAHLRAQGHQVRGVDLRPLKKRHGDAPIEITDLLTRESAARAVQGVDAVVHLANWPNAWHPEPTRLLLENVTMNQNLIQAMLDQDVAKLVFASSIQTLAGHIRHGGDQPARLPYLPLDGDVPADPANIYGLSKQMGENQCRWFCLARASRRRRSEDPVTRVAALALRLPYVLDEPFKAEDLTEDRLRWAFGDEAFLAIHVNDAARLVEAILLRHDQGYRCIQAGSRDHWLPGSPADLAAKHYPDIPLKRPAAELTSLCDLDVLERDFGWVPRERLWVSEAKA